MTVDLRETTSGVVGAVFNVYFGLPFDVIKVRLQTQSRQPIYHGFVDCFTKTVRQESVRSLWKGAVPALSSTILENAVLFSANGAIRRLVFDHSANELSTMEEALVGSASGFFSAAAITPAEVIKCRLQTYQHAESMGIWRCIQTVVRESGLAGLTAGLPAVMLRDVPFNFCFFGAYDYYTNKILEIMGADSRRDLHPLAVLTAGGLAGATSWTAVFPADVIKSRMQVDASLSFRQAVRSVWRVQGVAGFYRGWSSAVMGSFPADGSLFLGVEMTHRFFAHLEMPN
ncbi:Mitochondrial Carrier (MC) Family [Achlya hypogyna]|uniref:Mitochondrial Carrier (MC) Family n=1 Tax=Achlya hypogyna TaxID=1202772 RepID=A0A1V9Z7F1_ACHHY|nr:Mitochondrial Carrier (MC) Family [Achlya hypogyna]